MGISPVSSPVPVLALALSVIFAEASAAKAPAHDDGSNNTIKTDIKIKTAAILFFILCFAFFYRSFKTQGLYINYVATYARKRMRTHGCATNYIPINYIPI